MIGGGGRSSDCGARARINSFTIDLSIAIISYLKKVARVAARHWVRQTSRRNAAAVCELLLRILRLPRLSKERDIEAAKT